MVCRVVIGLLLLSGLVFGQRSDTVFKQVFSNISVAPSVSGDLPNIGQSQHVLYVRAADAPSKTCSAAPADIYFEISYDGSVWFRLSAGSVNTLTNNTASVLMATGLAPHVRVNVNTFDTTNCRISVYYGGSLYPVYTDRMEATFLAQGYQTTKLDSSTAGTYALASRVTGKAIVVYSLTCNNQTAQTIAINTDTTNTFYVGTNDTFSLQPTGLPHLVSPTGFDLSITFPNSTHVTCFATYRYE